MQKREQLHRPKLVIPWSASDYTAEAACWVLLAMMWTIVLRNWQHLPERIPIHFNFMGTPDRYGKPRLIFSLPLIASALFIVMTVLNRYPHIYNYPVTITPDNAKSQYRGVTRFIRFLKLGVMGVFTALLVHQMQIAQQPADRLGKWFLPVVLLVMFVPTMVYVVRTMFNNKKK